MSGARPEGGSDQQIVPNQPGHDVLVPEDVKIVTLARSARARLRVQAAAAVRDLDGRTYVGADVELPSMRLSALQVAVAMAVSSGATGLEAAAVVTASDSGAVDATAVRDLGGSGVPVHVAAPNGRLAATFRT